MGKKETASCNEKIRIVSGDYLCLREDVSGYNNGNRLIKSRLPLRFSLPFFQKQWLVPAGKRTEESSRYIFPSSSGGQADSIISRSISMRYDTSLENLTRRELSPTQVISGKPSGNSTVKSNPGMKLVPSQR